MSFVSMQNARLNLVSIGENKSNQIILQWNLLFLFLHLYINFDHAKVCWIIGDTVIYIDFLEKNTI